MLRLTAIHQDNFEAIYHFMQELASENGFENQYQHMTKEAFRPHFIELLRSSKGIVNKAGYVPNTYYFLWVDYQIVGLFKVRHYLNDSLREGSGHIGFSILPIYRGLGYAKEGLKMVIDEIKDWIVEDEIYMKCLKTNQASLQVQLAAGAYIHHEDDLHYYTRIKIQ
ncbi:MAG TPA: GNAT family N-acetyltransferase [Acholeplasma sp.]|jgi:predicted acetyltransferase